MKVEKVNEKDIDLKVELEKVTQEKNNLQEQIKILEDALNERDLAIYNLAIKMSKL